MEAKFSVLRKIDDDPKVAVHGQVFTKPHIVELILDLAGYTVEKPLSSYRLLDPGCGAGAFVTVAADRLLKSLSKPIEFGKLSGCLLAVEKDQDLARQCRQTLRKTLESAGATTDVAKKLATAWVLAGDFLAHEFTNPFDFVVGNPPYVRQEAIPKSQLEEYRVTFDCFYDRADLYVAFLEKGLKLLSETGTLGFICPNRFAKNRYGCKLRAMISKGYRVKHIIDLPEGSPFDPPVSAYPGIYIIGAGKTAEVDHVQLTDAGPEECRTAQELISSGEIIKCRNGVSYHRYEQWFTGEQQWSMESPEHLALLRKIEVDCVPLEASGCRVGIGVATGADKIYLVKSADVEPELMLPIALTSDILTGAVNWTGTHVINPFAPDGSLIDLSEYPRAKRYFEHHRDNLCRRNVAKRNAQTWYRTIDKIHSQLTTKHKLLIPDIKADNLVAYEEGKLYPHHNLYFVTSDYWDLHAMQTILKSSLARFFVWMYAVRMRGDFLRFQAQYLRRICVPKLMTIKKQDIKLLAKNCDATREEIDEAVFSVYGLKPKEVKLVQSTN